MLLTSAFFFSSPDIPKILKLNLSFGFVIFLLRCILLGGSTWNGASINQLHNELFETKMSGGNLSSRVKNMKFMQVAGDKKRKDQSIASEKEGLKKLRDSSEWTLPVIAKTLKVIKSKNKRVRKVGFSKINSLGPVNMSENLNDGTVGRMKLTITKTPENESQDKKELVAPNESKENISLGPKLEKKSKSKKSRKSKNKTKIMAEFATKSDEEFDPTEVDLTSKSLLDLWKANKK